MGGVSTIPSPLILDSKSPQKSRALGPPLSLPHLPLELILHILDFLPRADQKTFALLSRGARSLALSSLFRNLKCSRYDLVPQLERISQARREVKQCIRQVKIQSGRSWFQKQDPNTVLFDLLESIPHLRSLSYTQSGPFVPIPQLRALLLSSQSSQGLEEFAFEDTCGSGSGADGEHDDIWQTVVETCPRLRKLSVVVKNEGARMLFVWKDTHLTPLTRFTHLIHLTLSCTLESPTADPLSPFPASWRTYAAILPWFLRCYLRRLNKTREIAQACPRLKRCEWVQLGVPFREGMTQGSPVRVYPSDKTCIVHAFVVVEGEGGERIVRGVEQWWMKDLEGLERYDLSGILTGEGILVD